MTRIKFLLFEPSCSQKISPFHLFWITLVNLNVRRGQDNDAFKLEMFLVNRLLSNHNFKITVQQLERPSSHHKNKVLCVHGGGRRILTQRQEIRLFIPIDDKTTNHEGFTNLRSDMFIISKCRFERVLCALIHTIDGYLYTIPYPTQISVWFICSLLIHHWMDKTHVVRGQHLTSTWQHESIN